MDILQLIPQRPPMVMIDRLVTCEGKIALGMLFVKEENVFVSEGKLTESGMIEALAQTAAARTGWLMWGRGEEEKGRGGEEEKGRGGEEEKGRGGEEENVHIPVGVIGSIKDFHLYFYPRTGDEIQTRIEVIHEVMNASVVKGSVQVLDELACDLEMKIFLTDGKSN